MAGCARTIVVVDDDRDLRELITLHLAARGCRVVAHGEAEEALAWLRGHPGEACAILLDLMMPRMDGWRFREEQLADPAIAGVPVVVLTADPGAAGDASLRASAWLEKPFDVGDLFAVVSRLCRGTDGTPQKS